MSKTYKFPTASIGEDNLGLPFEGSFPTVFVHKGDIKAIKAAARLVLDSLKPASRLEVIARALRFSSFASMNSFLKRATPRNPLPLQVAFGAMPDMVEELIMYLSVDIANQLEYGKDGIRLATAGAIQMMSRVGELFLRALMVCRQNIKATSQDVLNSFGDLSFLGRRPALVGFVQGLDPLVLAELNKEEAVLSFDELGKDCALTGHIFAAVRRLVPAGQLSLLDEADRVCDYERRDARKDNADKQFPSPDVNKVRAIPLNAAVFLSNSQDKFEVHRRGWSDNEDLSFSFGAVFTDWARWSKDRKIDHMVEMLSCLTQDFDMSKSLIEGQLKKVVGLTQEDIDDLMVRI